MLEACSHLKALVIPFAGLPAETRDLLVDFPQLDVFNLHHNAAATAEMAAALLQSAAKQILPMDRMLRAFDWRGRYQPNPSILLESKTALILGFGAIGRRVAGICRGFGIHVLAVRRRQMQNPGLIDIQVYAKESLLDLIPRSNVLIVCLPWTPETDGLIGAEELDLLPQGSILVNVAREPIVVEQALFHALKDGRLASAGLDVWYQYPESENERASTAPSRYPFHELDNVVMSPHRAGGSQEIEILRMKHLAALIQHALAGEELPNKVDPLCGY